LLGTVVALNSTPRSFLPMKSFDMLTLIAGVGVEGDRYSTTSGFYSHKLEEGRQLTLIESETLVALRRDFGIELSFEEHRRNITTCGVALAHFIGRRLRIGPTLIEPTRISQPCKHLEEITGKLVYTPMLHRGGVNAKILEGGSIRVGDEIHIG